MTRERRTFGRASQPFDAQYRLSGELTASWRTITTVNISAGGMRFTDMDAHERGTSIEVRIQLPSLREPFTLQGRIAWSQMQASGVAESGVEFLDLTPEQQVQIDQLVQFLQQ